MGVADGMRQRRPMPLEAGAGLGHQIARRGVGAVSSRASRAPRRCSTGDDVMAAEAS